MSRQSMQPSRPLSLTEELEKLEQSITLTLQGKVMVNKHSDKILIIPQRSTRTSARLTESSLQAFCPVSSSTQSIPAMSGRVPK